MLRGSLASSLSRCRNGPPGTTSPAYGKGGCLPVSDGERGPWMFVHTGPQASQTIMGTAVNHYAAIDVSLELPSVCIVDATGKVVKQTKVETRPEALVKLFKGFGFPSIRIGLEAGPLSQWLYAGLTDAGFETTGSLPLPGRLDFAGPIREVRLPCRASGAAADPLGGQRHDRSVAGQQSVSSRGHAAPCVAGRSDPTPGSCRRALSRPRSR
jgi:hypothetical protein